jgi:hypothetical protein
MSKVTDASKDLLKVFNDHQLAVTFGRTGGDAETQTPYIDYRAAASRSAVGSGWLVYRPGKTTDPKAHWADYGNKSFPNWTMSRAEALDAAKAWAGERYGVTEWQRSPFGGWHPAHVIEAFTAAVAAARKAARP